MNRAAVLVVVLVLCFVVFGQTTPGVSQIGVYGPWLADHVLGEAPVRVSFRTGKWKNVAQVAASGTGACAGVHSASWTRWSIGGHRHRP